MQIDRDIKDIPLNDIDEIEWLKIRQMEDRDAEHDDLTYLGLSMATRTAHMMSMVRLLRPEK